MCKYIFISMHGNGFSIITLYFIRIQFRSDTTLLKAKPIQIPSLLSVSSRFFFGSSRADQELNTSKLQAEADPTSTDTKRRFQKHTLKTIARFGVYNRQKQDFIMNTDIDKMRWPIREPINQYYICKITCSLIIVQGK